MQSGDSNFFLPLLSIFVPFSLRSAAGVGRRAPEIAFARKKRWRRDPFASFFFLATAYALLFPFSPSVVQRKARSFAQSPVLYFTIRIHMATKSGNRGKTFLCLSAKRKAWVTSPLAPKDEKRKKAFFERRRSEAGEMGRKRKEECKVIANRL